MNYTLICDGAFSFSKKQMGIGIVFLKEEEKILEYSKMFKDGTNNIAEIVAIIIGLRFIKKPISSLLIVSDSMYCIGTITLNWKRKKNVKLWELFDKEYSRVKKLCSNIEFKHIKGHQKDDSEFTKWNNYCDHLANKASNYV